jgi:hypothetical protein
MIVAIAKTVAEQLMREIMKYDGEFRRDDTTGASGSHVRH